MSNSNMSSQLARLASFSTWPSNAVMSCFALVKSGFKYTGDGQSTICTECQLVVDRWKRGDRPDQVHRERSPNCAFVREQLQIGVSSDSSSADAIASTGSTRYTDAVAGAVRGFTTVDNGCKTSDCVANASDAAAANHLSCTIDRNNPNFERLKDESVRLSTFHDWPAQLIVKPGDLAKAGMFYTGQSDRVQCAFCQNCLRNWVQGDVPADEHRNHFPNCSFVRQLKDLHDGVNLTEYTAADVSIHKMCICFVLV